MNYFDVFKHPFCIYFEVWGDGDWSNIFTKFDLILQMVDFLKLQFLVNLLLKKGAQVRLGDDVRAVIPEVVPFYIVATANFLTRALGRPALHPKDVWGML